MEDIIYSASVCAKAISIIMDGHSKLTEDIYQNFLIEQEISKQILELLNIKIDCYNSNNIPDKESVMIAANHKTAFDILMILATINRPVGFVPTKGLYMIPFIKDYMKAIKSVPLNRSRDSKSYMSELKISQAEITTRLIDQYCMTIFPEGKTIEGNELGEFASGSFRAPRITDSYIVPAFISTNRIFKEGSKFILSKESQCIIHYDEPFKPSELGMKTNKQIKDFTYEKILKLKDYYF